MRKPLLAANWKMNKTAAEAVEWLNAFYPQAAELAELADTAVCAPFTALFAAGQALQKLGVGGCLGAQDMYWEASGAYTGEVSAQMLLESGVRYVICGHSERRTLMQEGSAIVAKKCQAVQQNGMLPILCVGESESIRQGGLTLEWLEAQLFESLEFWDNKQELVIAYEPVWAIGTGLAAGVDDVQEACGAIRRILRDRAGEVADTVRILYGGSVTAANIGELMACEDVDGALVGGASLKPDSFIALVRAAVGK